MPKNNQMCKILIVDNDIDYAQKIAIELSQIRPDLLQNQSLEIEISNTAYFVGKCLETCPNEKAPWDIILSDVYMPIPSKQPKKNTAQQDAQQKTVKYKDQNWKLWEYEYTWNSHQEGTPDHGGLHIAQKVKNLRDISQNYADLKVILISSKLFDPVARDCIYEYLRSENSWFNYYDKTNWEDCTEDWPEHLNKPDVFRWAVIHAINERFSESWGDFITDANDTFLVVSKSMKEIVIKCKTLAKDISVNRILITGERGIGKSAVSHLLHKMRMDSSGLNGQFVTVQCTSTSDGLFDSELFGHLKGSFTGAICDNTGFVETAKNGTLFFDEIGDLSPANQGKILRLLQEGKFVKVGDNKDIKMEASLVVFATNKNLEQLKEEGLFRKDLYDRMDPSPIEIPPLRERRDEIIPLSERFIKNSQKNLKLSQETKEFLKAQAWEGNVRQLELTIAKAATFCTSAELKVIDLQRFIPASAKTLVKNSSTSSLQHPDKQHEFTPENIIGGKIKWASVKKKPYYERAAVMIIARSLWGESQKQLAELLEAPANNLEQFFSTIKRKFKNNKLDIEDLKQHIGSDFHPLLEKFLV